MKPSTTLSKEKTHAPLSNLNYDLLTVLQNKLKAVAAYEIYLADCQQAGESECQALVADLKRDDERHIERLRAELERLVKAGKFH